MMENALAMLDKYKEGDAHLLLPSTTEVQINPYYKFSIMEVKADVADNSGDIFTVGKSNTAKYGEPDKWVEFFSPAKPLLMKIATAAGIQFDPERTGRIDDGRNKNYFRCRAVGAVRLPDGTWKVHTDEKSINLDDEEDKFRLEFMDKSIQGITGKAGYEAAKLFKGKWGEVTKNDGGKEKAYMIDESDRQKYIDRGVMVNMMLLRKNAEAKCMTGAILRVVRALIGMKGQYSKEELKKPFVVARVSFNPDYSDPEVRRAMLEQGLSSMNNVFGGSRPALSGGYSNKPFDVANDFNAADYIDNDAFKSEYSTGNEEVGESNEQVRGQQDNPPPQNEHNHNEESDSQCSDCGKAITASVAKYSKDKHGRALCMKCQKGAGQ